MSEAIDLSSEQCKQVARRLRTLLSFFDPPRDKRGVVNGQSRITRSFATAWGWQLPATSSNSDFDDPEGDLDYDTIKPSPGALPSGIRGKGGHGDPTLAAVLNSLGRRDDKDLTYQVMLADLETVGDAVAKLISDVTTVTPQIGSDELHNKLAPKANRERPCASAEQGCPDMATDEPRRSYCEPCFKWIDENDGGVVPRHVIDNRLRQRKYYEKNRVHVSGPLADEVA